MRSSSKKRATAKERELAERIKELEKRLAASAPKAEFEAVKSREHTDLMVHGLFYSSEAQVTFERSFSEIDPMKPHIDQWNSKVDFESFLGRFGKEYEELDGTCKLLLENEVEIGSFEQLS